MAELEPLYSDPPTFATLHQPHSSESKGSYTSDKNVEERAAAHAPGSVPSIQDILSFVGITIMLVWPWIFFGVVWAKGGIQMNVHFADVVTSHPHTTTYLITFICSLISLIVSELFSLAIIRFAQELVTYHKPTQPFHLTVLLAFRRQTWPWGKSLKDVRYLMTKNRWWPAASVIICALIFPHLISSTTTLLTPTSFNRTAILTGTELDFSSTDTVCLNWFNANPLPGNCSQQIYNGQVYTNCLGGSQTVDILEAGRGKVLQSLTNNSESITYGQLGAGGGLHFQGSVRGVLPLGPNGVPAFNASLKPSPLSNPKMVEGMISYDYTLNLQGLTSDVSCSYSATSPFRFQALDSPQFFALAYNANCAELGELDVLTNVEAISSAVGNSTLGYWACQSAPNGIATPSYSVYLAGVNNYAFLIGNITCTLNSMQSALFPVTYRSTGNFFSIAEPATPSPLAYSTLMNYALLGLGDVIVNAQNFEFNLFADSVIDYGQKFFHLPADLRQVPQYLELYEQMIQGIIEYEMTYLRLLYSTLPDPPPSCLRTVTGVLHYEVLGWFMTDANIGFLIPITIINLGALFALARAMAIAKNGGYMYPPSHPRSVEYDERIDEDEQAPDEWLHKVSIRPTTALKEHINKTLRYKPEKGVKAVE